MSGSFTILDGLIIFAYLIAVLSMGFYYSQKTATDSISYFLAGRDMGWFVVGMSIFATNISSEHFIGLAGGGAQRGLAVGMFELMAIFTLIILGWVVSPVIMKSGVITMPEYLGQRFDKRSRKFFAALSILIYIFTKITVTLFAGGILFYKLFGINIYASAIIIVLITGLYSVIGGASAVMRNHLFQAVLLLLAAVLLTTFGLIEAGGLHALRQKLPSGYFELFKPMNDPDFPWTGIVFGAPILAFWYWCTDQYIVQRVLSARNINEAARGSLLAAALKITPIFILVLPGLIAVALFPEIKGDDAYPVLLASNIIPTGVKGLILTGVLAAIMSSLASVFNSTATIFTNDFYKMKYPQTSENKLILIGRLATTVVVIMAILCVPLVKIINTQLYLYLQSLQAYVAPPITAVFLFGLFFRKITARAAFYTLVIGEGVGLARLIIDILVNLQWIDSPMLRWLTGINFLHFAVFLFVLSSTILLSISFMKEEAEAPEGSGVSVPYNYVQLNTLTETIRMTVSFRGNLLFPLTLVLIAVGLLSFFLS